MLSNYQSLVEEETKLSNDVKLMIRRLNQLKDEIPAQFKVANSFADTYSTTRCVGCGFMYNQYKGLFDHNDWENRTECKLECGHVICNTCVGKFKVRCLKCKSNTIPKIPRNLNCK